MDKNENQNISGELKNLSEMLDKQMNGEIVNDTILRDLKRSIENLLKDEGTLELLKKAKCDEMTSGWLLFVVALMSYNPLSKDEMTDEFKEAAEKFIKDHHLEKDFEKLKKEE